jgi:iron-sulfur cluster assembly protein
MITTAVAADRCGLLEQRGTPGIGLRIGVPRRRLPGNCTMEFCETGATGDEVVESNGVRLFVDLKSMVLLGGTEIDYVEGLMGAGFKFNNPNVKHNCACGESFSA